MPLQIAARLRPFSRRPGVPMLLPGTGIVVTAYPSAIILSDVQGRVHGEMDPEVQGPVDSFTVQQDMERCRVTAWGNGQRGFFRWHLYPTLDRAGVIFKKDKEPLQAGTVFEAPFKERISLGDHRILDWDLVVRRGSLAEILPVLWRLGQLTPTHSPLSGPSLLADLQSAIAEKRRDEVESRLVCLLRAGFYGLMVPSAVDHHRQGFPTPPMPPDSHPLSLVTACAQSLRELFIVDGLDGSLSILPLLPGRFVSGRLLNLSSSFGCLDIEWTKRFPRTVYLRCKVSGVLRFVFPKEVATFRVRRHLTSGGDRLDAGAPLEVLEGQLICLDRFQA